MICPVYDIVYDIAYDMLCDMPRAKSDLPRAKSLCKVPGQYPYIVFNILYDIVYDTISCRI